MPRVRARHARRARETRGVGSLSVISDDALAAWLSIYRYQFEQDHTLHLPGVVCDALIAKGWCTNDGETRWDGVGFMTITPAGDAIIDIHAPDYGIATIPEDSDAEARDDPE
jgi:hypothetical protein